MIEVSEADAADIDGLLALESQLFLVDAGRHDPFADTNWPVREGRRDLESLIASPDAIVLSARNGGELVGLLAGYAQASSPTRQPVEFAVLRTMFVAESARRRGVGSMLVDHFLEWARRRGCAEAHVDHYAANDEAAALYERSGFEVRSISRALRL